MGIFDHAMLVEKLLLKKPLFKSDKAKLIRTSQPKTSFHLSKNDLI